MQPSRKRLTLQLIELLDRMFPNMPVRSPEEWSGLEFTLPQIRTLLLLSKGAQRMGSIARHLSDSLPTATGIIDRLSVKGLVERVADPHDRRVVACRLTSLGEQEVEQFSRIGRMKIEAVAEGLTEEELEIVVKAAGIVSAAMERQTGTKPREHQADSGRKCV